MGFQYQADARPREGQTVSGMAALGCLEVRARGVASDTASCALTMSSTEDPNEAQGEHYRPSAQQGKDYDCQQNRVDSSDEPGPTTPCSRYPTHLCLIQDGELESGGTIYTPTKVGGAEANIVADGTPM